MNQFLKIIESGKSLSEEQMYQAMTQIMEGDILENKIEALLTGLAQRGETVDEITGAAKVLREKARMIETASGTIDCCGTGGDKSGTYNISTAVAFVVAACGVPIAKHGNRAFSSKSGAADVLEALGVNLELSKEKLEQALKEFNFAFLMAPHHHEAMKHVASVRQKLGTRTIFNLLGPLANPAGTKLQLIGVFDYQYLLPMAETLKRLGSKRAWIVHGSDGLDEITTTGPTQIAILDKGKIEEKEIMPEDFGLPVADPENLLGGSAEENASALRNVLQGEKGAYRDIVLVNAAAVLCIHGTATDLKDGVAKAAEAIDKDLAWYTLKDYVTFSREAMAA